MTERRRFLRFNTALHAMAEIVHERKKTTSKIKNISKEGALIVLSKPLEQGSEINLSVDVPGDNIPIFASCEVAWQKGMEKPGGEERLYETGVKFKKMANTDKGRLLEYIYLQWLRVLDKPSK